MKDDTVFPNHIPSIAKVCHYLQAHTLLILVAEIKGAAWSAENCSPVLQFSLSRCLNL